jgi:hypothetical protein
LEEHWDGVGRLEWVEQIHAWERDLAGRSSRDMKKVEGPDEIKSNNTSLTPDFLHNIMQLVNLHKRVDSLISAITITKTRPKQRGRKSTINNTTSCL